jgi:hypothetical protein
MNPELMASGKALIFNEAPLFFRRTNASLLSFNAAKCKADRPVDVIKSTKACCAINSFIAYKLL